MTNKTFETIYEALAGMRVGLTGAVAPSLRAVAVDLNIEEEIYIAYFFYDGPIDDYLYDLVGCIIAEASDNWVSEDACLQLDYPAPIPHKGTLAYLRKEPGMDPPNIRFLPKPSRAITISYLAYAMQQGLLGRVISSLREVDVYVDDEKKLMKFSFFYDEEITEEILVLSKEAIETAKKAFIEPYQFIEEILFYPFPARISLFRSKGCTAYARDEHLRSIRPSPRNHIEALLWMGWALDRWITPALRAISISWDEQEKKYVSLFVYDQPLNKELQSCFECTADEISESLFAKPEFSVVPKGPVPVLGHLAYARWEAETPPPSVQLLPKPLDLKEEHYLMYAMQQGMLGRTLASLRSITVDSKEQQLIFYFYYDEEISQEILQLSKEAIAIAKGAFPKIFSSKEEIVYLPFPQPVPVQGRCPMYHRKEQLFG